jgi:NAD(P)-dependent dehydrogenase (short-subunit alcohol dehydrogenase family)
MVPMKKVGEAEDVANAIVFMSSTDSPFMTGAVLTIDGGICA